MIELTNITKTYKQKGGNLTALNSVSLKIEKGDIFGIVGSSGAGKSTLLRCINYLDPPTSGTVKVNGKELSKKSRGEINLLRQTIGMIFQNFNLFYQSTVYQNAMFALKAAGKKDDGIISKLLEYTGLTDKRDCYPATLSGGQRQRAAIIRALAIRPQIMLCDEATSALDSLSTLSILQLLKDINKDMGVTIVLITHQMGVIQKICNKAAVLERGSVIETGLTEQILYNPCHEITKNLIQAAGFN